ncbi:unnamed protein product [Sympodiomycopsis kandeliae]
MNTNTNAHASTSAQPSTADIQRSQALLSNIATLLDSKNISIGANPDGFPGLIRVLPHILSPLKELQNPQQQHRFLTTYQPLIHQVQAVVSQLVTTLHDPTVPIPAVTDGANQQQLKPSQALQIAQAVHSSQRQQQQQQQNEQSLSAQEQTESIMRARRKRRRTSTLAEGSKDNDTGAMLATAAGMNGDPLGTDMAMAADAGDEDKVPSELQFKLPPSVIDREKGPDGSDTDTGTDTRGQADQVVQSINRRLRSFTDYIKELDKHAPAYTVEGINAEKKSIPRARASLSKATKPDQPDSKNICSGVAKVSLPSTGQATVWFDCVASTSSWETQVTNVNIRSVSETSSDSKSTTETGTDSSHIPSTISQLRQLSQESLHPSLEETILCLLSLRTLNSPTVSLTGELYNPIPPSKQDVLPGSETVVLLGWFEGKSSVRWAWCQHMGGDDPSRHWRAYRS